MAVMLALAVAGAVIRWQAPPHSGRRDVGTLLLVMWLPAVGNLIGFLARKIPRSAPPPTQFAAGSPFTLQALAQFLAVPLPEGFFDSMDRQDARAVVISGRHGYTVRLDRPVAEWLAAPGEEPLAMEFLLPKVALLAIAPGMTVHLLVGKTAVAKGMVLERKLAP
ncbi:MAG: hypothetical protein NVS2B4_09280 [Ramlibacter sp.]